MAWYCIQEVRDGQLLDSEEVKRSRFEGEEILTMDEVALQLELILGKTSRKDEQLHWGWGWTITLAKKSFLRQRA